MAGAAAGAAVADAARAEPRPARPVIEAALLERAGMVPWSRARSRVSEEIRLLQSQLLRSAFAPADGRQTPLNLVMVTSARPGEGKSFAALNIGGGIARQQDREVLLVDADGKPDSLGQKLGLAGAPGLLDLITDPGLDVAELVVPSSPPEAAACSRSGGRWSRAPSCSPRARWRASSVASAGATPIAS